MSKDQNDRFQLEELALQPGTYFNPVTEVVIVVDDSVAVDPEGFGEVDDDSPWVRIAEETPVDEQARDVLFEEFQARREPEARDEDFDEVDKIEPDPDVGE